MQHSENKNSFLDFLIRTLVNISMLIKLTLKAQGIFERRIEEKHYYINYTKQKATKMQYPKTCHTPRSK
jgi:hypothetical protein